MAIDHLVGVITILQKAMAPHGTTPVLLPLLLARGGAFRPGTW